MTDNDYKQDEIIDVKLPRKDFETLREILERESAYTWLKSTMRSWWLWTVVAGIIGVISLYDIVKGALK